MWQRFSQAARKAVFYAQEEAEKYRQGLVSPAHLLLGALREADSDASVVLAKLGLDVGAIRKRIGEAMPDENSRPAADMTLSPRSKRMIDLAYQSAKGLGQSYIGTAHLLMGILEENDSVPAQILSEMGVSSESVRYIFGTLEEAEDTREATPFRPAPVLSDTMLRVYEAARKQAQGGDESAITPEIFLLAMAINSDDPFHQLLSKFGFDWPRFLDEVCSESPNSNASQVD